MLIEVLVNLGCLEGGVELRKAGIADLSLEPNRFYIVIPRLHNITKFTDYTSLLPRPSLE
jgi:hypothetical protein